MSTPPPLSPSPIPPSPIFPPSNDLRRADLQQDPNELSLPDGIKRDRANSNHLGGGSNDGHDHFGGSGRTSPRLPSNFQSPIPRANSNGSQSFHDMQLGSDWGGSTDDGERKVVAGYSGGRTITVPSPTRKGSVLPQLDTGSIQTAPSLVSSKPLSPMPHRQGSGSSVAPSQISTTRSPPPSDTGPTPSGSMGPPSTSTSTQPTQICAKCEQPMQGQFVRALGTVYHLDCFRCQDCNKVVAAKFFPIDGPEGKQYPLCETDYFRRLNLLCAKCGGALRGSYITALDMKFHV
ncbi:hypothetical protein BT69DRAFT_1118525, partial [Atractiella rhizophila]